MKRYLVGIDEAGRGPLAGPVAVGAVIVPRGFDWASVMGARDSKQMTPKSRDRLYAKLCALRREGKLDFAVSFSCAATIDRGGIVCAVQSALDRALRRLIEGRDPSRTGVASRTVLASVARTVLDGVLDATSVLDASCCEVLLDGGLHAPPEFTTQKTIIRGDESEPIISLASIAAKVMRDRLMIKMAVRYSAYDFQTHKGYGTSAHRAAIARSGLCSIHRTTFCRRVTAGLRVPSNSV